MNGIFIVDKPEGMTSRAVVDEVCRRFALSKAGHLGTLDPMATGVLPVCAGKGTRLGQFLPNAPKEYTGTIRLGFSTTTYDREGVKTSEERPIEISREKIKDAMRSLTGALDQVPPPFSAKKVGGVRSYKLARKGRPVDIAPVRVTVDEFGMTAFEPPLIHFRVVCSPGTYIRSLAHDLGQLLGCGAHLTELRRTRSGEFKIAEAIPLESLEVSHLIALEVLLDSWPRIDVSETEEVKVLHGNEIQRDAAGEFARIFNKKGDFIAVGTLENGWVRPRLVLTSITSD